MEIGKFKGKYRIQTNRLNGYDYSSNGIYFITICTKEKIHYFGEIVEPHDCAAQSDCAAQNDDTAQSDIASLHPTEIGKIANEYWYSIPEHYPFVILDEFIVMPNHLHGIVILNKEEERIWAPNVFGTQSRNLGAIIRGFKSSVKRYANEHNIDFYWQSRFYDHIIQNEITLFAIRNYIKANPSNWARDKNNGYGLKM